MDLNNLDTYDYVVMWGAGRDVQWYNGQFRVDFIVDKDLTKVGDKISGIEIKPLSELTAICKDNRVLIIISSSKYSESIKKEICDMELKADVAELSVMRSIYAKENVSFALWGLDILVRDILVRCGYDISAISYIEIGACHPIFGSNTYIMYKEGARGYLVEPNVDLQPVLRHYRSEDTCIMKGIASQKGCIKYYMFDNMFRNTFDAELAQKYIAKGFNMTNVEQIPVDTLESLIDDNCIDTKNAFLSIQAMGLEKEILREFSYKKYKFPIIAISYIDDDIFKHPMLEEYHVIAQVPRHIVLVNDDIYNRILG